MSHNDCKLCRLSLHLHIRDCVVCEGRQMIWQELQITEGFYLTWKLNLFDAPPTKVKCGIFTKHRWTVQIFKFQLLISPILEFYLDLPPFLFSVKQINHFLSSSLTQSSLLLSLSSTLSSFYPNPLTPFSLLSSHPPISPHSLSTWPIFQQKLKQTSGLWLTCHRKHDSPARERRGGRRLQCCRARRWMWDKGKELVRWSDYGEKVWKTEEVKK